MGTLTLRGMEYKEIFIGNKAYIFQEEHSSSVGLPDLLRGRIRF